MSNESVDILLVEDDRRLADLTAEYFRQNGLTVAVESRGDRAVARFKADQPRIVLLDLMLPGADGLTICRELREFFNGPILIFTARDSDIDQVIGLEAGADDYVAKPVDPMVLLARTRALLRRVEENAEQQKPIAEIVLGGLRISEASQDVWLDGANIQLTTQESRGDRAVARFKTDQPRIVLLDLMLPGADGLTICRELREFFNGPILIFTARDSDIDQVIGLEAGADDYVAKPVDPMVLLARTRALLRRVEENAEQQKPIAEIVLGGLRISEAMGG